MALFDALRALTASPHQALVWDCSTRQAVFTAAFELHEVAVRAGFSPDEATTLSLTLVELATRAVGSGRASVHLRRKGWRIELPAQQVPAALENTSNGRTTLRQVARHAAETVAIAEYQR